MKRKVAIKMKETRIYMFAVLYLQDYPNNLSNRNPDFLFLPNFGCVYFTCLFY